MVRTLQEGIMKSQTGGVVTMERKMREKEDEDTDDSEDDNDMNAFTKCITEIDCGDESECSEENCDEELTFEELKVLWKEDYEAKAIQK
ncbi:uncharacterized protein E5676_scaffold549G00320 [Cucumis melo var. makuwa]|uniref:Uncharacterized protein n=1 Tax=Cucumis melo var. makuwa TaxID=1194695 RepID=A0A5A7T0K5_CUCMM|nr:uncharacterized protein E6C27_scaffold1480G00110 [Cucumis melo var. makuwa]TYJ96681.1 uncharacterized protein E5676_scaffold549G00320 [Cucumis melo var. makuwa]